jgi:hypothetical protein
MGSSGEGQPLRDAYVSLSDHEGATQTAFSLLQLPAGRVGSDSLDQEEGTERAAVGKGNAGLLFSPQITSQALFRWDAFLPPLDPATGQSLRNVKTTVVA